MQRIMHTRNKEDTAEAASNARMITKEMRKLPQRRGHVAGNGQMSRERTHNGDSQGFPHSQKGFSLT